jgi:hypothetical protein
MSIISQISCLMIYILIYNVYFSAQRYYNINVELALSNQLSYKKDNIRRPQKGKKSWTKAEKRLKKS